MNLDLGYGGTTVVVTGAASGMGAASARLLQEGGATVVALDIREPEGDVDSYIHVDLADRTSIDHAIDALPDGIVALFSCAGLPQTFPAEQVIVVNFVGPRHLIEHARPKMASGGAIATIASVAGFAWQPSLSVFKALLDTEDFDAGVAWCAEQAAGLGDAYSVSKMALTAYTMTRCAEYAQAGLRLNTLSPGPTDTPMMPHFEEAMGKEFMHSLPVALDRYSTADEQAVALLVLNSPHLTYLTGANLFNDGGMTANMAAMMANAGVTA